jgi:hypothetical protein
MAADPKPPPPSQKKKKKTREAETLKIINSFSVEVLQPRGNRCATLFGCGDEQRNNNAD